MIEPNIDTSKIEGLDRLYRLFPQDYSFDGVSFKGILLNDDGDIQMTYTLEKEKTYTFVFFFSEYEQDYRIILSGNSLTTKGIDISCDGGCLHFVEQSNGVDIKCQHIKLTIHETLSREFGKEQANILTKRYSMELQKKFETLEKQKLDSGEPLFRRDDSYNGIASTHHTMYKLPNLTSKDGSLEYEFLIEMDRNDPCLGIYYGCKGLIKKGNNLEQQKVLRNEWENSIKSKVTKRLNELFPGKNFTNRFKPTDNANDNTFWPFWITLYEDESMEEVALRATIIVRDEYKRYLEGRDYMVDETSKFVVRNSVISENEVHSMSSFTEESWEALRNPWTDSSVARFNKDWADLLDRFIKGAVANGLLVENVDGYEKAYQFKKDNTNFVVMMQLLLNRIKNDQIKVPWERICSQFIDKDGEPFKEDSLKNACSRYWKRVKEDFESEYKMPWSYALKEIYENSKFPDRHVKQFKKIMQ